MLPRTVPEPATLHLEELWIKNVTITTGLVDAYSTATLLDLLAPGRSTPGGSSPTTSRWISLTRPTTCSAEPADTGALKVVLNRTA